MKVLIYKRTQEGDPDPKTRKFGVWGCMKQFQNRLGVAGAGPKGSPGAWAPGFRVAPTPAIQTLNEFCNWFMGKIRDRDFDAVIGIGGIGQEGKRQRNFGQGDVGWDRPAESPRTLPIRIHCNHRLIRSLQILWSAGR